MSRVNTGNEKESHKQKQIRQVSFTSYERTDIAYLKELSEKKNVRYVVGQQEKCPDTGRLHIQGYIQFIRKVDWRKIKTILGERVHFEQSRGTPEQNKKYCTKEETRTEGPAEYGEPSRQGKRKDLEDYVDRVLDGATEKQLMLDPETKGTWARHPALHKRVKTTNIDERDPNKPPQVAWLTGATGTGKSRLVWDGAKAANQRVYAKDNSKWWDGYEGQEVIFLDEFNAEDHWKIEELLRLIDRYPYRGQVKGGYIEINSPFIYIATNKTKEEIYPFARKDQIEALERRLNVERELTNNN